MLGKNFFLSITITLVIGLASLQGAFAIEIQEVSSQRCGIKALLVEDNSLPIISAHIAFNNAGSAYGEDGLAMMTAGLLDKGAGDLNAYQFAKKLEKISSHLSFSIDKDFLHVNLKTLKENRQKALELMVSAITDPNFEEKELEITRKKMLANIKKLSSNPNYIANMLWNKNAFQGHPYSKSAYGNISGISKLKRKDVVAFFKNNLSKDMFVSFAGDINKQEVALFLDNLCGFPRLLQKSLKKTTPKTFDIDKGFSSPQSIVVFGSKGIARNDEKFFPTYLLNHILGGGTFSSRLMKKIRVENNLTYGIGTYLGLYEKANIWKGSFSTKNERVDEAVALLKEEIKNIIQNGISEKELQEAKDYLKGSFILRLDDNDTINAYLFSIQRFNLGLDYFDKRNDYIENVTLEEINKQAKEFFNLDNVSFVKVGNINNKE